MVRPNMGGVANNRGGGFKIRYLERKRREGLVLQKKHKSPRTPREKLAVRIAIGDKSC